MKSQSKDFCSGINPQWVNDSLKSFSFGIASYSIRANIGSKTKDKSSKYYLYGFILCRIEKNNPTVIWIDLICSRNYIGKKLIQLAEVKIATLKDINVIKISPTNSQLVKWYRNQGYLSLNINKNKEYTNSNFNNNKIVLKKNILSI